jgi:hypothetical protein
MSVSVDTVYQRVLAILNKEQRGYVTPQEFNLFANQAQLDIFEQYFYDINQFGRMHGNDTEYSDMLNLLNEKINIFEVTAAMTHAGSGLWTAPANLYRIGTIIYNNNEVERINQNEFLYINKSPLTKPSDERPIFIANTTGYKVYGAAPLETGVTCNYIKRPATVEWAGTLINGSLVNNAGNSVDFELHPSEETELVYKILELAGIAIKDPSVYQIGNQMESQKIQQEKA